MLDPKLVLRAALLLAPFAVGCVSSRPADPVDDGRVSSPPAATVDVDDLFARLRLELRAAWREGDSVVLDIQEQRDEAALSVLSGFDAEIVGDAVYLTPRYGSGTSGRRQRFRMRLALLGELPEGWRERVYLVVDEDLQPLPPGERSAPPLRQRIVLGARSLS